MSFQARAVRRAAVVVALAVAVGAGAGTARATDYTWDSAAAGQPVFGGDGTWSAANSWTTDNGANKTTWLSGSGNNAIFGGPGGMLMLTSDITARTLAFNAAGYKIMMGGRTLTLTGGGTIGTGLVDFNVSGVLALKNDAATSFNLDVRAVDANGKITAAQNSSGAADTRLTAGNATVGAGRILSFDGSSNYRVFTGDVSNSGVIQALTSTFNGAFIAGGYSGAGTGSAATDTINAFRGSASAGINYNVATDGSDVNGQGGVFFSGAGTRNVGNLKVAYAASGSTGYGGTFGAVDGAAVHITNSYAQYRDGADALVLLVRNGGQIIFDAGVTYVTGNAGHGASLQTQLSGDGQVGNAIDFGVGAANPYGGNLDLGKYVSCNGAIAGYSNGSLVVGGLNLITHSGTFTNTRGLTFSTIDDDGLKYGDITKTRGAGWTIKDNAMTVTGSGGTVSFAASRSLDVQAGDAAANGLSFQCPVTIAAGRSVYKWGGATLTFDTTSTVNSAAAAGALYAREGTTIIKTSTFKADLIVGGGSVTTAGPTVASTTASVWVPAGSIGGALTVGPGGQLHPSTGSLTQNLVVAGGITLLSGAEFDFNFNGSAHDSISGAGLTIDGSGSYTLRPNVLAAVPVNTYTLLSGTSFTGALGTWTIVGNPAGWSIVRSGNEIDLVVAGGGLGAGSGTWTCASGADARWTTQGNWTTGYPSAAGHIATFGDAGLAAGAATVDLGDNQIVGGIVLDTATGGYTLGVNTASHLTLDSGPAVAALQVNAGAHTVVAPLIAGSDMSVSVGNGASLHLAGGVSNPRTLTLSAAGPGSLEAGAITGTGSTLVPAGSTVRAARIAQNSLIVNGRVQISATDTPNAAASTSVVNSLTLAVADGTWTGQFDLGNNSLVIKSGGSSARAVVADQLRQGLGLTAVVDPNLGGITSSTALALGPTGDTTLGYALTSDLQPTGTFAFAGQTVDGDDVLVKYTWKADANLDGIVNVADLGILATNYGLSGKSWATADFNGDGLVNVADLGLLATYYGRGTSPGTALVSFPEALAMFPQLGGASGSESVPEPASLGLLGLGAAGLLVRPRKKIEVGR